MLRPHPMPMGPVQLGSVLSVLVADWLAFGLNIAMHFSSAALITGGCAAFAGLATFAFEHWLAPSSSSQGALKGLFATLVVALPMPVAGTFLAAAAFTWALVAAVERRRSAS